VAATAAPSKAEPGVSTLGFVGMGIMGVPMVSAHRHRHPRRQPSSSHTSATCNLGDASDAHMSAARPKRRLISLRLGIAWWSGIARWQSASHCVQLGLW
jgi:hypothetical protein